MLGLAHVLVSEGLHDTAFLDRYTVGADRLIAYVARRERRRGRRHPSGRPPISRHRRRRRCATSPAAWREPHARHRELGAAAHRSTASSRCGWASRSPRCSARSACPAAASATATARWPTSARRRCRTRCRCSSRAATRSTPTSRSRRSPSCSRTPAARSTTTAARLPLPDIRLVYWAGGNPFHHHQDLNRLRRALRPARHRRRARAVLDGHRPPRRHRAADHDDASSATTSAAAATTATSSPCRAPSSRSARPATTTRRSPSWPSGSASWDEFTEGRTARDWVEHIYERFRRRVGDARRRGARRSTSSGRRARPGCRSSSDDHTLFDRFRADPDGRKLPTPSGRIELFSETIDGVRLRRLPRPPGVARAARSGSAARGPERFPLHLIANQPSPRLHGQLDAGAHSQAVEGRGPRADPHPPRRRRGARHRRRRRRARVQRPGRLPRRRRRDRRRARQRSCNSRPARGSTRRSVATGLAVRARQPERAHPRPRHVAPGAGLDRPALPGRDRALRRRPAPGPRPPPPRFTTTTGRRRRPMSSRPG